MSWISLQALAPSHGHFWILLSFCRLWNVLSDLVVRMLRREDVSSIKYCSCSSCFSRAVKFYFCMCYLNLVNQMSGTLCLHQWCTLTILGTCNLCDSVSFGALLCVKDPLLKGSKLSELTLSIYTHQALWLLIVPLIECAWWPVLPAAVVHI